METPVGDSLESSFDVAVAACVEVEAALKKAVRDCRAALKAARMGDSAALAVAAGKLQASVSTLPQGASGAADSSAAVADALGAALRGPFLQSVGATVRAEGGEAHLFEGRLLVHPSAVSVDPAAGAVRVDGKLFKRLRPSVLGSELARRQRRQTVSEPRARRFLESLFVAYCDYLAAGDSQPSPTDCGPVVKLVDLYRRFTYRPDSLRDYPRADFVRDLYALDSLGAVSTRSGLRVRFSGSTGTRDRRGVLTYIGPGGREIMFFGVSFGGR